MKASKPLRTCLGCRGKKEKAELIRLCFDDGVIRGDKKQVLLGRGCYVCPDPECLRKLIKGKRVFSALRIKHDAALIEKLKEELKGKF